MTENHENSGRKILFIDDDAQLQELVSLILKKNGFEGIRAANGPDGLSVIASEKPDLVLLDLMMPGMDGWGVYKNMRADEAMQDIPVIIVTCKAAPIDIVLGKHVAKVNDYITKPFTPGVLIDSINQVLGVSEPAAT